MKKFRLLALLLCLVVLLAGCGNSLADGTVKDMKWPDGISINGLKKPDKNNESENNENTQDTTNSDSTTDDSDFNKDENIPDQSDNSDSTPIIPPVSSDNDEEDKKPVEIVDTPNVIREEALNLRLTKEVLDRSIVNQGNMSRIAKVIKKAIQGEDVTIGFIGGSITEGTGATTSTRYANVFKSWWEKTFTDSNLTYINAGMGATDSMMGVHRADGDLLNKNPDLVVIDFTVNDTASNGELFKESYESLIRKILKKENSPAIISIFMFDQNGVNLQDIHSEVGKHYDIPMVGYKNALWPAGGEKVYKWSEIGADNIHPNQTGHAILGELLIYYVNTVRAQITKISSEIPPIPDALTDASFENGMLLTNKNFTATSLGSFQLSNNAFRQFQYGWTVHGGYEPITFTGEAKNIYILYLKCKSKNTYGTVSVKLDGNEVGTMNGDYTSGWGDNVQFFKVLDGGELGSHTVSVQLTSQDPKIDFAILGIMIS